MRRYYQTALRGFVVAGLAVLAGSVALHAQTEFTVTIGEKTSSNPYVGQGFPLTYYIDGVEAVEITLSRGVTYTFQMSDIPAFHPFYLTTQPEGSGAAPLQEGVTGNGASGNATLTFTPGAGTPDTVYYGCTNHDYMGYRIIITDESSVEAVAPAGPGLTVTPQPARESVRIEFSKDLDQVAQGGLYDVAGNLIQFVQKIAIVDGEARLDVSDLTAGSYFLLLEPREIGGAATVVPIVVVE